MRYFLFCLVMLLLTPLWAANINESVAAISYNPSRLGAYKYLKVVKEATFTGGIKPEDATEVNLKSTGTINLTASEGKCEESGCLIEHEVTYIQPMSSNTAYCNSHPEVCGSYTAELTTQNNTVIQGTNSYKNAADLEWIKTMDTANFFKQDKSFPSDTNLDVTVRGGTLIAVNAFVKQIDSVLNLEANENFYGTVTVPKIAGNKLQIGNTIMPTVIANWPSACRSIGFEERIDMYGAKARIMTCK